MFGVVVYCKLKGDKETDFESVLWCAVLATALFLSTRFALKEEKVGHSLGELIIAAFIF